MSKELANKSRTSLLLMIDDDLKKMNSKVLINGKNSKEIFLVPEYTIEIENDHISQSSYIIELKQRTSSNLSLHNNSSGSIHINSSNLGKNLQNKKPNKLSKHTMLMSKEFQMKQKTYKYFEKLCMIAKSIRWPEFPKSDSLTNLKSQLVKSRNPHSRNKELATNTIGGSIILKSAQRGVNFSSVPLGDTLNSIGEEGLILKDGRNLTKVSSSSNIMKNKTSLLSLQSPIKLKKLTNKDKILKTNKMSLQNYIKGFPSKLLKKSD